MLCVRSSGNPFVLAVIHRMVSAGANRPMRSLHSSLRVIRISTNARHSERSEEPPHFRPERRTLQRKTTTCSCACFVFVLAFVVLAQHLHQRPVILSEAKNPRISSGASHPSKKNHNLLLLCFCPCFCRSCSTPPQTPGHSERSEEPPHFRPEVASFKEKPQLALALALALFLSLLLSFLLNTSTNARHSERSEEPPHFVRSVAAV